MSNYSKFQAAIANPRTEAQMNAAAKASRDAKVANGSQVASSAMATEKQVSFLRKLVSSDYSLATTYGLHNTDPRSLTMAGASKAISQMLAD